MADRKIHARGALVGVLVGDSIGATVEGDSPAAVRDRWRTPAAAAGVTPGPYSAVSEMTASLAESLAGDPQFDGEDFARRLVARASPRRGYGEGTQRAIDLLKAGGAWDEASAMFPGRGCYGNGAAARAVPVGLFGSDIDWLRWLAEEQAVVTHAHALAAEGAVVIAIATALLIETAGQPIDPQRFLESLAKECHLRELRDRIAGAADLARKPFDSVKVLARLGNNATALGSVATAVYCFVASPEDFVGVVGTAFQMGGNATSIAAMAGGLAGAYLGIEEIPENWVRGLERGDVTVASLSAAADKIIDAGPR
ncbi:MAG: poly(ADP-ribose) glycohydrolase ARH3 [Candidatus Binatia bacterium]